MTRYDAGNLLAPEGYLPAQYRLYESGVWRHTGDETWKQVTKRPVSLIGILASDFGDDWTLFLRLDKGEFDSPSIQLSYSFLLGQDSAICSYLKGEGLSISPLEMAEFRIYLIKSVMLTGDIQAARFSYVSGEDILSAEKCVEPRTFNDRVAAAVRQFIYRNYFSIIDYDAYSYWRRGKVGKCLPPILYKGRYLFADTGLVKATEGVPASQAAEALRANDLLVAHKGSLTCRLTLSNIGLPLQKYYAVDVQRLMAYQTYYHAFENLDGGEK